MDAPSYEKFSALSTETFEDVSKRTGVPVELLMVVREAAGGAQPTPTDKMRDTELESCRSSRSRSARGSARRPWSASSGPTARTWRRMAAAEGDWWRSQVLMPRIEAGHEPG